jgi:hypothetical protein
MELQGVVGGQFFEAINKAGASPQEILDGIAGKGRYKDIFTTIKNQILDSRNASDFIAYTKDAQGF